MNRKLAWVAGVVIALLVLVEGAARLSGIADVPLYNVDSEIGYIPAPNQSGAFLRKNDWIFNERSMGSPPFAPEGKTNVLLLGDSIVYGGDPFRQREKLGPRLTEVLGGNYAVWSAAAGRWGALNEMTYLQRNADLPAKLNTLVWVLITPDFERRMLSWSDLIHPQKPPLLASVFGLRRFILPRLGLIRNPAFPPDLPENAVPIDGQFPAFEKYLTALHAANPALRILLVQYPSEYELTHPDTVPTGVIARELRGLSERLGIVYFQVSKDKEWLASYYRDSIHPTAEGNVALAHLLAGRILAPQR